MQNPYAHEEDTSKTGSLPEGVKVRGWMSLHGFDSSGSDPSWCQEVFQVSINRIQKYRQSKHFI